VGYRGLLAADTNSLELISLWQPTKHQRISYRKVKANKSERSPTPGRLYGGVHIPHGSHEKALEVNDGDLSLAAFSGDICHVANKTSKNKLQESESYISTR
jgi:hypothetical protein